MIGAISEGVKANKLSYEALEENLAQALDKMGATAAANAGGAN
jgi:hypothetical protein